MTPCPNCGYHQGHAALNERNKQVEQMRVAIENSLREREKSDPHFVEWPEVAQLRAALASVKGGA